MLSLHTIKPAKGSKKNKKRVGRGGKRGTYAGKGLKGQKARSGTSGFKRRGMKPLVEATPKLRGFKSKKVKPKILNLDILNKHYSAKGGSASGGNDYIKVNPQILKKDGLVDVIKNGVKILGNGEIKVKLNIEGCSVSKSAQEKIEEKGGKII